MHPRQLSFVFLLWTLAAAASAADHACAAVVDPAGRLACYDRAFPPTVEVRAAAERRGVDEFGSQHTRPSLATVGQTRVQADPDHIQARVAKLVHASAGRTVTLDNGHVWTVTEATSRGPLREGDEVVVRRGLMGNYVLVTAGGVGLRVRRVR
jgi:hypothetical protein